MGLLDTIAISELRKAPAGRADPNVVRWADAHPLEQCYLSAIVVKELTLGVLLMARRDAEQGRLLSNWLSALLKEFADRIVPVDDAVARLAARLHVPDPAPEADAYIAATAIVHGMDLVTRNTADFARFTGLSLVNPFQSDS